MGSDLVFVFLFIMCGRGFPFLLDLSESSRPLLFLSRSSGRHGGLMVSVLDSGLGGQGSSPGRGHCVVFLGKTLFSHSASLHPGVQMGVPANVLGVTLQWTSIPSRGE